MKKLIALALALSFLVIPPVGVTADDAGNNTAGLVFDEASPYIFDGENITVDGFVTASEVRTAFRDHGSATVAAADGTALSGTDVVCTGATVSLGGDSATVIVPGDVNGDGKINARDVISAMRCLLGETDGLYAAAADLEGSGKLNARDVLALMRYLVGWDQKLGPFENTPAPDDDGDVALYFDSILHRIGRSDTTVYGEANGEYYAAKNEVEDAQIILTSTGAKSGLTLVVGDLANADGDVLPVELHFGYYYYMAMFNDLDTEDFDNYTDDWWVDPYPLLHGQSFEIGANESKSFMAQITVPADAKSGWYSAPVTLCSGEGKAIKQATLRIYVWDFALDEETACNTLFLTWSGGAAGYYASVYGDTRYHSADVWTPLYKENFFDYMLDYRISGYELPYDVLDSRVNEYLDNPRVTSFISEGGMVSVDLTSASERARLRAVYNKLETNPVWAEKAYIYTVDEPYLKEGADLVIEQWNNVSDTLGDTPFKTIVPYGNMYLPEVKKDQLEYLWDFCNCFCPSEGVFTPSASPKDRKADPVAFPEWGDFMDNRQFSQYGNYQPRYDKLRERGDTMWWYVCCGPEYPYANFFNYYQGEWTRMVLWEQYLVHSDGILYWSTNSWTLGEHDTRRITLKRTNTGGDGLLIYDGMLWGEPEPCAVPTSRLEAIRDGIEDFQFMKQLERALGEDGRNEVLARYVTRLATDVTHFEQDYRVMEGVRGELGFELEDLASGN